MGPDTQYAVVRIETEKGKYIKLKGKVDTGAQVNLLNSTTFKQIFGENAQQILHSSTVRLTGYGGRKFTNHGKFRVNKVHHNEVTGQNVEFYVSDFGSNLFSLRFCKALKIVKLLCDKPDSCRDCHGDYDVSEVQDRNKSTCEKTENKSSYSEVINNLIEVSSTEQVIKEAQDVFTGTGKLKGYQYKIEINETAPPVVCPPRRVSQKVADQLKGELDNGIGRYNNEATKCYTMGEQPSMCAKTKWEIEDLS